jgi:helicase
LAESLGLPPAQAVLKELPSGDPSLASQQLREALRGGVRLHIADLDPEERPLIEEHFRRPASPVRVIVATTTLAMGVNTPAEAVVIAGLEHPGRIPYTIAEYKSIAGRAGRLGLSSKGASYLIALNSHDEHYYWTRYIQGRPEDITSRFLQAGTDPRSLIIRVLAAASRSEQALAAKEIIGFLEESFGAFQQKQSLPHWRWDQTELLDSLRVLHSHRLIETDHEGRYRLTDLGRIAGEAGVEVKSMVRLIDALSQVEPESIHEPALIAATQLTVELDQELFPINKKSTQWMEELRWQDHRIPGGMAFSVHSIGHLVKSGIIANAMRELGKLTGTADEKVLARTPPRHHSAVCGSVPADRVEPDDNPALESLDALYQRSSPTRLLPSRNGALLDQARAGRCWAEIR